MKKASLGVKVADSTTAKKLDELKCKKIIFTLIPVLGLQLLEKIKHG